MQQQPEVLNLSQALSIIRRRLPVIILCMVLAACAAYGYSVHEAKKYSATASLVFNNNSLSQQIAGLPITSGSVTAQQSDNLELVKTGNMAISVARALGSRITPGQISESVSVTGGGESNVVAVTSSAKSPRLAAQIANAYTAQFVAEQRSINHQYFKSALSLVNKQLAELPAQQRFSAAAVALQNRAQTLRLLDELQYGNVRRAQAAIVPAAPSAPNVSRNTVVGAAMGLLIGFALAFSLERLDGRIRRPEELEAIFALPLLGEIPKSGVLAQGRRRDGDDRVALWSTESEAFNLMYAHLRFFNVDRLLRTVVIASASPGDGKTVIARNLAESAARLGSRVLLMEFDLRRPTLAQMLELRAGPGLSDVLLGSLTMDRAIQSVNIEGAPSDGGVDKRVLDVLTAGAVLPPNPGELLVSRSLDAVLLQVRESYDLVVMDTPALSAVSDAFPLLSKVDGVVIVGWIGRSPRDAARRLHQILKGSTVPLLGVVANGSKSRHRGSDSDVGGGNQPQGATSSVEASESSEALI